MGEAMHTVGTKNNSPPGMSLRLVQELAGHDDRYPAFLIDMVLISWCCVCGERERERESCEGKEHEILGNLTNWLLWNYHYRGRVWSVAWRPGGGPSVLASCSGDKTVRIWEHSPGASPSSATWVCKVCLFSLVVFLSQSLRLVACSFVVCLASIYVLHLFAPGVFF
jgi:hypothetical protein